MALRGDFQGGASGGQTHMGVSLGASGLDGNIAIEKYMKWHWGFFGGAVLVTATAVGTQIHWISHFTFAPATFLFEIFLLLFGILMLVLDTPVPHVQNHPHVMATRFHIYKFALFMTRFTGRGIMYLFLASLVFGALWDTGINWFLGAVSTIYLVILGVLAIGKGCIMSNKLNQVRDTIQGAGHAAERYVPSGQTGLSIDQLKLMVESATNKPDLFNKDELAYVMNALSFKPNNEGHISLDELKFWFAPGPPMLI